MLFETIPHDREMWRTTFGPDHDCGADPPKPPDPPPFRFESDYDISRWTKQKHWDTHYVQRVIYVVLVGPPHAQKSEVFAIDLNAPLRKDPTEFEWLKQVDTKYRIAESAARMAALVKAPDVYAEPNRTFRPIVFSIIKAAMNALPGRGQATNVVYGKPGRRSK